MSTPRFPTRQDYVEVKGRDTTLQLSLPSRASHGNREHQMESAGITQLETYSSNESSALVDPHSAREPDVRTPTMFSRSSGESPLLRHSCSNCGTTRIPIWRRSSEGAVICNACGLYFRSHKAPRPRGADHMQQRASENVSPASKNHINLPRTLLVPSGRDYYKETGGSCPGSGNCNGTGGADGCEGCPVFYNRNSHQLVSDTREIFSSVAQGSSAAIAQESNAPIHDAAAIGYSMLVACRHCGTTITPMWRRDERGHSICNACGLYYKLHRCYRPATKRKAIVRRRQRLVHNNTPVLPSNEPISYLGASSPALVSSYDLNNSNMVINAPNLEQRSPAAAEHTTHLLEPLEPEPVRHSPISQKLSATPGSFDVYAKRELALTGASRNPRKPDSSQTKSVPSAPPPPPPPPPQSGPSTLPWMLDSMYGEHFDGIPKSHSYLSQLDLASIHAIGHRPQILSGLFYTAESTDERWARLNREAEQMREVLGAKERELAKISRW